MHTLTVTNLRHLADLLDAVDHNRRVAWMPDGGRAVDGVVRHFTDVNGNFPSEDTDVRDTHLRISGTFEYFLPVRDVLGMMHAGTFTTRL